MDDIAKKLTEPDEQYMELCQLLEEAAIRSLAKTQAAIHGETIDMKEHEYSKKMMESVAKDPENFILQLPFVLDGTHRAIATLTARNNHRLLRLIHNLISGKLG